MAISIEAGTDTSRDIVLGDNGQASFTNDGDHEHLHHDPTIGGDDDILVGNGDDIVMGGAGSDAIDMDRTTRLSSAPIARQGYHAR